MDADDLVAFDRLKTERRGKLITITVRGSREEAEALMAVSYTHLDVYKRQGLEKHLPGQVKKFIADHNINLYTIDGVKIGIETGMGPVSYTHLDVYKRQI